MTEGLSRRRFAQSLGIVVATFALPRVAAYGQASDTLLFRLRNQRRLEGWIRLEPDETVTVFTGKAELGQGILTALAQIAAEERAWSLDVIVNSRTLSSRKARSPCNASSMLREAMPTGRDVNGRETASAV
jgi:nicotinate dehydrogenase subunit B